MGTMLVKIFQHNAKDVESMINSWFKEAEEGVVIVHVLQSEGGTGKGLTISIFYRLEKP